MPNLHVVYASPRQRLPKDAVVTVPDANSPEPPPTAVSAKPITEMADHLHAVPRVLEVLDSYESSPTGLPAIAGESVNAGFIDQSELAELAILRRKAFAAYADVSEPHVVAIQEPPGPTSFAALLKSRLEQPEPQAVENLEATDNDLEAPLDPPASEDVIPPADVLTQDESGKGTIQEGLSEDPEVVDTQEQEGAGIQEPEVVDIQELPEPLSFTALMKSRLKRPEPRTVGSLEATDVDVEAPLDPPASEDVTPPPADVLTQDESGIEKIQEGLSDDGVDTLLSESSRDADLQILPSLDFLNSPIFFSSVSLAPRAPHGINKNLATASRTSPGNKLELRGTLPEKGKGRS